MASSSGSSVEPRLALPRSSTTAALWGHLLHKKPHTSLAAKSNGDKPNLVPPMKPVDKAGTSARMLLHDTQAVLEKFSGKIDKLHSEVEQAKNEVSMSHKVFQHGNDKVLSDQVDLINRCQTQLQKSIGKPAQVANVEELLKTVELLTQKFDGLDRRIDALNMLNQTQLRTLQTIQEQQGQLLTLISPLTPLIESIPLYIDSAKNDIKNSVREAEALTGTLRDNIVDLKTALVASLSSCSARNSARTPARVAPLSPCSSPSQSPPKKRRKANEHPLDHLSSRSTPSKKQRLIQSQLDFSFAVLLSKKKRNSIDIPSESAQNSYLQSPRENILRSYTSALDNSSLAWSSQVPSQLEVDETSQTLVPSNASSSLQSSLSCPSRSVEDTFAHPTRQVFSELPAYGNVSSAVAEEGETPVPSSFGNMSSAITTPTPAMNSSHKAGIVTPASAPSCPTRPLSPNAVHLSMSTRKIDDSEDISALQSVCSTVQMSSSTNDMTSAPPVSCPPSGDPSIVTSASRPMSLKDRRIREASSEMFAMVSKLFCHLLMCRKQCASCTE
ncbi:hypothetical protein BC629DRAFT_6850 [Irpex lacteus]|nr:hypothetical protein BC629DRAFT_6850 [Irpex lacteus]